MNAHPVFFLTATYFLLGAMATVAANRRASADQRWERWKKIAVYFLIVHLVLLTVLANDGRFAAAAVLVISIGLFELMRVASAATVPIGPRQPATLLSYIVLSAAFVQFARSTSSEMVLFVYVVVLTFDGFSQVTGQLFGRHKLAPRISPGKTVEGLLGGFIMAAITAVPLSIWSGLGAGRGLGLTILIATFALAGDLAASAVKRACMVKDYGNWIPGHGGILDRFDSFIVAGGAYWFFVGR